jgi:DNA-binding HxlR family transcriptional regulator
MDCVEAQPGSERAMTYDGLVAAEEGDGAEPQEQTTALQEALSRVGDRWTLLLVEALLPGPRRFNELIGDVAGIAPNILSDRLKRLERDGILVARPYSRRPPRFAYELSADGRELAGALRLLADWGSRRSPHTEPLRHARCGTPLEARWFCPTCARPVEDDEAGDVDLV